MNINKLNPRTVDILRDTAVKIEKDDLMVAFELMSIAYTTRPGGPFIKKKVEEYSKILFTLTPEEELKKKMESGEVIILPIGFRCHTNMKFKKKIRINQKSSIFNSGFFPPSSVVSIFKHPKVNLKYSDKTSHSVCIKYEHYSDTKHGKGIKFKKTTYDEINSIVTSKELPSINRYLDSTFGYYTLDNKHNFVLAHYNWHKFANTEKSKGIIDPAINLKNINEMLNRRIDRMFEECHNAKHIFFIYLEDQGYNYMMIDDNKYDLHDFKDIYSITNGIFDAKINIIDINKINNAKDILNMIR